MVLFKKIRVSVILCLIPSLFMMSCFKVVTRGERILDRTLTLRGIYRNNKKFRYIFDNGDKIRKYNQCRKEFRGLSYPGDSKEDADLGVYCKKHKQFSKKKSCLAKVRRCFSVSEEVDGVLSPAGG